jgi:FimV-like protein
MTTMGEPSNLSRTKAYISALLMLLAVFTWPAAAEELVAGQPHIYGPVGDSESLKSIATLVINKRDFKLRETMADIFYANPDAFVAGRSHILHKGVLLKLPEYLAWGVESSASIQAVPKPAAIPETPKQTAAKIPQEQASSNKEVTPAPVQTPQIKAHEPVSSTPIRLDPPLPSVPGSKEDIMIQLQLLKGEIAALKRELASNQEETEISSRLQGAYLLMTVAIFLVLITLLVKRSSITQQTELPPVKKPAVTDQSQTQKKVKASLKKIVPEKAETSSKVGTEHIPVSPVVKPRVSVTKPSTSPAPPGELNEDVTPASPALAYEDPTPMAPSAAYDDITPVSPSLAYQDKASSDITEEEDSNPPDLHEVIHDISDRFKGMSDDKDASNLALARVYMDLGDYKQAKPLLTEVHKSVTPEYARQAEEMIHELLQSEMFASSFHEIIDGLSDEHDSVVSKQLEDLSKGKDPLAEVSDSFLAENNNDEIGREFEMAQIYFELGDYNRCKQHLAAILGSDGSSFKTEAYALLKDIESIETSDDDMTMKSTSLPDGISDHPVIKEITPPDKTIKKDQLSELSNQFMAISSNKNGTKLALAHVHIEMGEHEMALKLLKEIITSGDNECTPDAEALLKEISDTNQA